MPVAAPRRPPAPRAPIATSAAAAAIVTPAPAAARPAAAAGRPRRRLAAALAVVAVLLASGAVTYALIATPAVAVGGPAAGNGPAWRSAAAWIARQIGRDVRITCDQRMCEQLRWDRVPSRDLRKLPPGPDAVMSTPVIVATHDLRRQLGNRLSAVVATGMIAQFGSGSSTIQIRVALPVGASFRSLVAADVAARKADGTSLLNSPARIMVAAPARRQLTEGQVDSRLLIMITALGALQPVQVLSFGDPSPGAGLSVSPLRSVVLAQPASSHAVNTAYIASLRGFVLAQRGQYRPARMTTSRTRNGRETLSVTFAAPSQLGTLGAREPSRRVFG
ncbi:MAG: hypothetical protein ACLP52_13695 [Streptosporangiaceae bacterium]